MSKFTRSSAIAVLGAGSWGTALAALIARNGYAVQLWDINAEHGFDQASRRE